MENEATIAINELNRQFFSDHPGEAVKKLEELEAKEAASLLNSQSNAIITSMMERLTPEFAAAILTLLSPDQLVSFLEESNPNLIITILGQLEVEDKERYLSKVSPPVQKELRILISYPDNSAGRLMDTRTHAFRDTMSVWQCLKRIRQLKFKPTRTLFLVNADNQLTSQMEIRDLAIADPGQLLRDLAIPLRSVIYPTDPREEIVAKLEEFKLSSLPVVNLSGQLVGVVRYDALVKAAEEEATLDIQTMFGVSKDERALSKPLFSVRKRLPWLQINLLTAFLAASVVGIFEGIIAKFTALAVLLPVVAGQSGNAGAQALAVTMRGLALKEIHIRQWPIVVFKEVKVGFLNGVAIALTTSIGVYFWSRSIGLALVIGFSMVLSMVAAGLAGASVPIILTRLGQDPATASSIILTTVTDVAGFFSFLGIATLLSTLL